jgi:TRAP-type C4-dicarboxylate transport system permease small subunit
MRGWISVIQRIDAVFDSIARVCAVISSILLALVTLLVTAGTINRAFIRMIWIFVEEWTALALIPMSYLVMGYTLRWNRHLNVDLVIKKLNARWRHIFMIFAAAVSLVCLGFMIERSWDWLAYTLKEQVTSSGPMRTPMWIFSASILVGLVLFAFDMILFLANELLRLVVHESPLRFHGEEEAKAEARQPQGAEP